MGVEKNSRIIGSTETLPRDTSLPCPICNDTFRGLKNLNNHLDITHGFMEHEHGLKSDEIQRTSTVINVSGDTSTSHRRTKHAKAPFPLTRVHWKKFEPGASRCKKCKRKLTKTTGFINCRRCGDLYCDADCKFAAKLNSQAEYDASNGEWCRCCGNCFVNKPGYNDYGFCQDKTELFASIRTSNSQDHQLQELQLENRFIRLINGIVTIHRKYENSILSTIRISNEVSQLEKTIVPWKNDETARFCFLCSKSFSVISRKHHCRLCGLIVCDDDSTGCSNEIPLTTLINAASDLPLKHLGPDVDSIGTQIRLCSKCIQSVFRKRKFKKEMGIPLSPLLKQYESLYNTSKVILSVLPTFEVALQKVQQAQENPSEKDILHLARLRRKLLEAFAIYDRITKLIIQLNVTNVAEAKIQQSIKVVSSTFIQDKMLPLKSIPEIMGPDITSRNSTPDSKTSSDILFNKLTIAEVKQYRTQLMVLKEQMFLVQEMTDSATKQRKFDEAFTLNENLAEIKAQVDDLTAKLGDQGFN